VCRRQEWRSHLRQDQERYCDDDDDDDDDGSGEKVHQNEKKHTHKHTLHIPAVAVVGLEGHVYQGVRAEVKGIEDREKEARVTDRELGDREKGVRAAERRHRGT
jgi:hypothetical protein